MTLYNVKKVLNLALESLCVWQSSKKRKNDNFFEWSNVPPIWEDKSFDLKSGQDLGLTLQTGTDTALDSRLSLTFL